MIYRLAQDLNTLLVYRIPLEKLVKYRLKSDQPLGYRLIKNNSYYLVEDLESYENYLLPSNFVSEYQISDDKLGLFLEMHAVSGVIPKNHINSSSNFSTKFLWNIINLGGTCNNHCKFCYTENTKLFNDFSTQEVKDIIDLFAINSNNRELTFSGGEPTIRKDIEEIFSYAHKKGFQRLYLQSNGRFLGNSSFLKSLVRLGLSSVLISLHGPNETVHDKITKCTGSFNQTIKGLKTINNFGLNTTINFVVCNDNYTNLMDVIELVKRIMPKGNRSIRISYPIFEGSAYDNIKAIAIPFPSFISEMKLAIKYALKNKLDIQLFGFPYCLINDYTHLIVNSSNDNSLLLSATTFKKYNISRGEMYIKVRKCIGCIYSGYCSGIQLNYMKMYPDCADNLRPQYRITKNGSV